MRPPDKTGGTEKRAYDRNIAVQKLTGASFEVVLSCGGERREGSAFRGSFEKSARFRRFRCG